MQKIDQKPEQAVPVRVIHMFLVSVEKNTGRNTFETIYLW